MVFEEFTTDLGVHYLLNLWRPEGCAIVAPGQYRGVWFIGLHNEYEALVQREDSGSGMISVYRDKNRDTTLDMDVDSIMTGYFEIDLHHGFDSEKIGENSAGVRCSSRLQLYLVF